ncbi:hypothetical protein AB0J83_38010 [Actinoplanes sp. NPDC049596]|uniref:hypothetical protein n=1 Tax=unclassified Actinoplanes TaxID=2626549 RepID=UPI0034430F41
MRNAIKAAVAGTAIAGTMLVATPGAALAANDHWCSVTTNYCSAGNTPANSSHQIFVSTAGTRGNYTLTVIDVNNGKTIHRVTVNAPLEKTLGNVWSSYEAQIWCETGCPGANLHIWS